MTGVAYYENVTFAILECHLQFNLCYEGLTMQVIGSSCDMKLETAVSRRTMPYKKENKLLARL